MLRFVESVLNDTATFYALVHTELHGIKGVDIYSDEPLGSNYSCFDYSNEGCDRRANDENDRRFVWEDCELTMDDDGLY